MYNVTKNIRKAALIVSALFISTTVLAQDVNDTEIKKNVSEINEPLQKLVQLEPKTYEYDTKNYKHLKLQPGKQYGFLADDVQSVFPDLVKEKKVTYMFGKNSYRNTKVKTIDESSLIPVLVASIKEQQQQIDQLKAELNDLKNKKATAAN